jgi:bacterioferritin-associated ferredoxin
MLLRGVSNCNSLIDDRNPPRRIMYVCLCNGFTDRQVRDVSTAACGSAAAVYRELGVQPRCGKCVPMVREMVRRAEEKLGAD